MYSSSSASKHHVSVPILPMQLLFILSVLSVDQTSALNQTNAYLHHKCINSQGTYNPGSPYEVNLKNVIPVISTAITNYGFVHIDSGEAPNTVFTKLQCRGDSDISTCRSCLTTASSEILKRCLKTKGKIIWYDNCLLEISPINTLFKLDYQNNFYLYNSKDASGDKELFNKNTRTLLNELKEKAISKENNAGKVQFLYATGERNFGTTKLYAMVQCTKDLSINNCNVCLNWIMGKLPNCCNGKQGGRVLSTSCNFRYELYPFVKPLVKT
ncbi:unnamed protein product [Thlaspi arvense]|uniref:Gnk2-homologous domain-containing protein n=1 Tax=Thlaspi arvense TaxID=13288 RepID=A0AAU9RWZ9_THLAR|nr:unnamed protein product [Thlaspi arvense]